jgi:hypothetical protein
MTPGGLRAQYLIPNLIPKCECLSIHSPLPFEPCHHAIPRNQRKQSFCRTETNCRPQASLPNLLKKSSPVERDLSPNQAHKSVPLLYQFLVLTGPPEEMLRGVRPAGKGRSPAVPTLGFRGPSGELVVRAPLKSKSYIKSKNSRDWRNQKWIREPEIRSPELWLLPFLCFGPSLYVCIYKFVYMYHICIWA